MPELPEVETVRLALAPTCEGARIERIELRRPDLRFAFPEDFASRAAGRRILSLGRRAKYLLARLDEDVIIMHLGMSGSFRLARAEAGEAESEGVEAGGAGGDESGGAEAEGVEAGGAESGGAEAFHYPRGVNPAHDHVVFRLEKNGERHILIYNDPRRFGFMDVVRRDSLEGDSRFRRLGVEPLSGSLDGEALKRAFSGKSVSLKSALLDQRLIAGVGNIYACESLWEAKLSPRRRAGGLGPSRLDSLALAVERVMQSALEAGGSSLRDHRAPDGTPGYFQHDFKVYGREGKPCPREGCSGAIRRLTQSGRSTFHCPSCQK